MCCKGSFGSCQEKSSDGTTQTVYVTADEDFHIEENVTIIELYCKNATMSNSRLPVVGKYLGLGPPPPSLGFLGSTWDFEVKSRASSALASLVGSH